MRLSNSSFKYDHLMHIKQDCDSDRTTNKDIYGKNENYREKN